MTEYIGKKGMLEAMDELCAFGAMQKSEGGLYASDKTGYKVSVFDDHFTLSTDDSIVHYFYDNLCLVVLYAEWDMQDVMIQVTPRRTHTGVPILRDSYHIATFDKGNRQYDELVLKSKE